MMIFSIFLALNAMSLLEMWFSLEMSFLGFIFLMGSHYYKNPNSMITYFLIQAFSGVWILLLITLMDNSVFIKFFMIMLFFMKMGSAPFHMWYFYMLKYLNWEMIWVLSSFQKFIPLIMMIKISEFMDFYFTLFSLLNIYTALILMNKTMNLKWIIGVSTLFNLGWLFFMVSNQPKFAMYFYLSYVVMLSNLLFFNFSYSKMDLNLDNSSNMSYLYLSISTLLVITIMGMPPYLGFVMKIYGLMLVQNSFNLMVMYILMIISVYLMWVYLSVLFQGLTYLSNSNMYKMNFMKPMPYSLSITVVIPLLVLSLVNLNTV